MGRGVGLGTLPRSTLGEGEGEAIHSRIPLPPKCMGTPGTAPPDSQVPSASPAYSRIRNLWIRRADGTMPFNIRDWSIPIFLYPQRVGGAVLGIMPCGYRGTTLIGLEWSLVAKNVHR